MKSTKNITNNFLEIFSKAKASVESSFQDNDDMIKTFENYKARNCFELANFRKHVKATSKSPRKIFYLKVETFESLN